MNTTTASQQMRVAWPAIDEASGEVIEGPPQGDALDHRTTRSQRGDQQAEIGVREAYAVLHGPMVP